MGGEAVGLRGRRRRNTVFRHSFIRDAVAAFKSVQPDMPNS